MYRITKRTRDGAEHAVYFAPDTLDACAGAMAAMTCGNRRDARHSIAALGSYSASNSSGAMFRAECIAGSRGGALAIARALGLTS